MFQQYRVVKKTEGQFTGTGTFHEYFYCEQDHNNFTEPQSVVFKILILSNQQCKNQ